MLGCVSNASYEELKQSYQKLVLTHHPDKVTHMSEVDRKTHEKQFIAIDKAWKVLGNSVQRQRYDAIWQQRCLAQKWPIQEEVSFEDFDNFKEEQGRVGDSGGAEASGSCENIFLYPCRCGSDYVLTEADAGFKVDYVCCGSCSLCIRILYSESSDSSATT